MLIHDEYCNRQHPPRQQCNRAFAPDQLEQQPSAQQASTAEWDGIPSGTWIGGLFEGYANATFPLCRLTIDEIGANLSPTWRWLSFFMPTYAFGWEDVTGVTKFRRLLSVGLRFHLNRPAAATQRRGLGVFWPVQARQPVFWCMGDPDTVLHSIPPEIPRS